MMAELSASFYWCAFQISSLALVGVLASLVVAKRQPAIACSIVCATVAASVLLTITAPLPIHGLFALEQRSNRKTGLDACVFGESDEENQYVAFHGRDT